MDHHKILLKLTQKFAGQTTVVARNLDGIDILPLLPEKSQEEVQKICKDSEDNTASRKYLQLILLLLSDLHDNVLSKSETFMSVNEYRCVKISVEHAISLGVFPCFLPQISKELKAIYPPAMIIQEELSDSVKYRRLTVTLKAMLSFSKEISLRPAILTQLGPILAGLIQLSHAPLMKPGSENRDSEFRMTPELFEELSKDQEHFRAVLMRTIKDFPLSTVIKELMVLFGCRNMPTWVKRNVKSHLIDLIIEPTGIYSLIIATCQDTLDLGVHWDRLETISKLVATEHGKDPDKYYSAVCSQLLEILSSKTVKNSSDICRICVKSLYESNPRVYKEKFFDKIASPLLATKPRQESEVSQCLEDITRLFESTDAKFKSLPGDLLKGIAVPLFSIYKKTYRSPSILKLKSKALLIILLNVSGLRDELFSAFLGNNTSKCFGERLKFEFGPTGGLETTGELEEFNPEDSGDCLFDLVQSSGDLPWHLFNHLQQVFSESKRSNGQRLEVPEDIMKRFEGQLAVMKLLLNLANCRSVQEQQLMHPDRLINFIITLFGNSSEENKDDHLEVLYLSLMLIKEIISAKKKPKNWSWTPFDELSRFLKDILQESSCPEHLKLIIEEIQRIISNRGVFHHFQDLSVDDINENVFDNALRDLADPLLPVRAHGLITLTRLIDNGNSIATSQCDLLLHLFQGNLSDEDSFIYLASINGLCSLAMKFPKKVIDILVKEFIDMPAKAKTQEILPENRAKLGEILVKVTRLLGEMAPAYKNILINAFLCGTRDSDPMIRASSLSCLGELCNVLGFSIGNAVIEVLYCISCIIETDRVHECRRAAVLVANLLIRGLGKNLLVELGSELLPIYRALKRLRDNDSDDVPRLHAQLALEELDDIVQSLLFTESKLEKNILLLK